MGKDTLQLLKDCTAGLEKTALSIDSVLPRVRDPALRKRLRQGRLTQRELLQQTEALLRQKGGLPSAPSPLSAGWKQLRADVRLGLGGDDTVAASLIANDCDGALRTLCRSRNRYIGAGEDARALADRVIGLEAKISSDLRPFL